MADSIKGDVEALREDLNALRSDESIDELRERLERLADEARLRSRAASETIQRQVEERPLTSLLVAFALGMVISRFFDRR